MTSTELKELVKSHFNLVDADVKEANETFGELKDENGAFTLRFPGDSLQVGDKVTVVTAEGQEMDAPNGEHRLEDGTRIVTEGSVVTEITSADGEKALAEDVVEEDKVEMAEEEAPKEEEMEEEVEEEMEEAKIEDIVSAIVDSVKEEMAKMKEKMTALEEKVAKMEEMPAAEPTRTSTGKQMTATNRGFSAFNVEQSLNADKIKMALAEIKTKKSK